MGFVIKSPCPQITGIKFGTQLEIFRPLVKECDLDHTKNLKHMLLILKLGMDINDGVANVHLDHSILGLLKGILHGSLGLGIQGKKGSEAAMWRRMGGE